MPRKPRKNDGDEEFPCSYCKAKQPPHADKCVIGVLRKAGKKDREEGRRRRNENEGRGGGHVHDYHLARVSKEGSTNYALYECRSREGKCDAKTKLVVVPTDHYGKPIKMPGRPGMFIPGGRPDDSGGGAGAPAPPKPRDPCPHCKGSCYERCPDCGGTGRTEGRKWGNVACLRCNGDKKIVCMTCNGTGEER